MGILFQILILKNACIACYILHSIFIYSQVHAESVVYDMESLCDSGERAHIYIPKWNVALLQLGKTKKGDVSRMGHKIRKCKVKFRTDDGFRMAAAIEHLKMRGRRNQNNKWICSDFIKFESPPRSTFKKILSAVKLLNNKESEELCGIKELHARYINDMRITDTSTDANSFHVGSNKMSLLLEQAVSDHSLHNNTFLIVVTSFYYEADHVFAVHCEEKHKCFSRSRVSYCVDPSVVCDGHINCAFPGSGTDERFCGTEGKSVLNPTTIIVITLASIVALGLLVIFIFTVVCRLRSKPRSHGMNDGITSRPDPTAPSLERTNTLPNYESVILSDLVPKEDISESENDDLPPNYHSIFPGESSDGETQLQRNS